MVTLKRACVITLRILSLLLFAATVTVWVASEFNYYVLAWLHVTEDGRAFNPVAATTRGRMELVWRVVDRIDPASMRPVTRWYYNTTASPRNGFRSAYKVRASYDDVRWGRFSYQKAHPTNQNCAECRLVFRLAYVAVLTAILPSLWLYGAIRRRRFANAGRCRQCGYDLRATPEGTGPLLSRCPECGAVAEEDGLVSVPRCAGADDGVRSASDAGRPR